MKPSNCELVIQNLKHQFNFMQSDETDINSYRIYQRIKRGLFNFGGKILNWLYGVIDNDTAMDYVEKINELENITKREHEIQSEQLLIIKETLKVNNDSFNLLNNKLDETMQKLKNIQTYSVKAIAKLQLDERFLELTNVAQLIIMEHERLSSQVLKSLENTITGKISQLIPLKTLTQDIQKLAGIISESQKLPIDVTEEDVLHIFKFTTTRAALLGTLLMIELTIPVVERTQYFLHTSIPIPIKIQQQTLIISTQRRYFLISNDLREYIEIEEKEYSGARTNRKGQLIFSPAQNAHLTHENSCEMSIFMSPIKNSIEKVCRTNVIPSGVYFIAIEQNSLYYIHVEKNVHILERCNGKASTINTLDTSGYLKLNRKCRINTDKISIRPHLNTRITSLEVVELSGATDNLLLESISKIIGDLPAEIEFKNNDSILIQNHNDDYKKLIDKTEKLITDNAIEMKFKQLDFKNIKTGLISSGCTISFSIILFIIIIIVIYKKFYSSSTWVQLAKKLQKNTENIPKLFINESA